MKEVLVADATVEDLGRLAGRFRGTRSEIERVKIADEYTDVVRHLINNGDWQELPAPEDMLPESWMPPEFFDYWMSR
jgi:hypothetical protein